MGSILALIILLGVIFGLCWLADKGFTMVFRGKVQHRSGKSVRLSKKYGSAGLILIALGVAGAFSGFGDNWLLFGGACLLVVVGIGLAVYYLSFGIYYDKDSFILSVFAKASKTYYFSDISAQQLYTSAAGIVIELYLKDGRTVQLQPGMLGVDAFMGHAFAGWLEQTGRRIESCDFHDPDNSCWFPPVNG